MVKYHGVDSVPQAAIDSVLEAVDVEFNLWRPESRINAINAFDRSDSLFQFVDGTGYGRPFGLKRWICMLPRKAHLIRPFNRWLNCGGLG